MNTPKSVCPVEWALYNEQVARDISAMMGREPPELELTPYEVQVVELPPSFNDLAMAINRAASELEGQGEKSDRIANQLLTALARFCADTGA